jgi:hypothetical protein
MIHVLFWLFVAPLLLFLFVVLVMAVLAEILREL